MHSLQNIIVLLFVPSNRHSRCHEAMVVPNGRATHSAIRCHPIWYWLNAWLRQILRHPKIHQHSHRTISKFCSAPNLAASTWWAPIWQLRKKYTMRNKRLISNNIWRWFRMKLRWTVVYLSRWFFHRLDSMSRKCDLYAHGHGCISNRVHHSQHQCLLRAYSQTAMQYPYRQHLRMHHLHKAKKKIIITITIYSLLPRCWGYFLCYTVGRKCYTITRTNNHKSTMTWFRKMNHSHGIKKKV